jgi:mono/diheme cytochrome c family protein
MPYRKQALMTVVAAAALAAGAASAQPDGKALFEQNCAACHQLTGKGIPGAFPALAGDPFVAGPAETVASVVLNGRGGMPTFGKDLSNEDVAAILTYVRSAWGNHASPLEPKMVESARNAGNRKEDALTMQAH